MTLAELVTRIQQKFGDNSVYYDPVSVILLGINPAMRLLTLVKGNLLTKRILLQVNAEASTFNLRSFTPQLWSISRVVLGDARIADVGPSSNRYRSLLHATIPQLAWRRDWLLRRGIPSHYWMFGDHWLGIYPRPTTMTRITVIFRAMPEPFSVNDLVENPNRQPDVSAVYHELIADIATALIMLREGVSEVEKMQAILQTLLSQEQLRGIRRAARQQAPMTASTSEAVAAGVTA